MMKKINKEKFILKNWKTGCLPLFFFAISSPILADTIQDPCAGPGMLLNLVNRPTVGDSACAVPFKSVVLESGYQYSLLSHAQGHAQNFPEAELRIGLPYRSEFVIVAPNYYHQTRFSANGFTATSLGLKHEIGYNAKWLGTVEALVTLPDGSAWYGSKGTGIAVNGIVDYIFNSLFTLTVMAGVTSFTQPSLSGGQRYTSFNPDVILTYAATNRNNLNFFGEVFGATQTAPGAGSGFNFDVGVLYLLTHNIEVDAEVGQRISGNLIGFDHYVGAGFSILI